uniref:DNA-directed RNA polymerase III subunit RPC4 n=3 Tax=Triticinae TaxID=1648030 RepID=A0A453G6D6_AEGTS|nr:DNA-directed RNA polymerase III subunit RPC4 isoform X1 [Aegilops tauschii subsp. strangulata]
MDAAGTSKRGRRPPNKPQKLKFKPKVPLRKPKKPPAQKPQLEETKPIDEELMKTLRTGRGDAKTLRVIKDEQSAQNSDSKTLSSAAGVSFQAAQSGKQKQPKNSQKALQIPRAFPANPERFYGDEDDEDEDEDEDDDNVVREDDNDVELPESLPSSIECESSIHPAKELNLLEHDDKTRMFLFQLPKSLPLLRTPSTVVHRNGRAIVKEVKEGYNLNDLPGGYMGKMLVYKSGKVKMKLGDAVFDVSPGTECGMQQHAVAVNTRRKHCCQLGEIERQHVVVTPDVNSLLNDNRD